MKNNYSESIGASLAGRTGNENPTANPENENPISLEIDQKGRLDKGLGKNVDGSFKQSNAGRRAMDKAKKKVQLPLTLKPATKDILDEWASTKARSAANYLSEYVEEHLNEIMDYFN